MLTVTLVGNAIEFGPDPSNPNQVNTPKTYVTLNSIDKVGSYFQKNTSNGLGNTPYSYGKRTPGRTTKTIVQLVLRDGTSISFDCDEVQNQPTWQGCQLANLEQAVSDITSWI